MRFFVLVMVFLSVNTATFSVSYEDWHSVVKKYTGSKISEVVFDGAVNVKKSILKPVMLLDKGEVLSLYKVDRDIKVLYGAGYFSSIRAYIVPDKNGEVKVLFKVKENPVVEEIEFDGMDSISESDVRKELPFKEGSYLREGYLEQAVRVIKDKYLEDGFVDAVVDYHLVHKKGQRVKVIFKVKEGFSSVVGKIEFVGNEHISADDLKDVMETSEKGGFLGLRKGKFNPETFEKDLRKIVEYYKDQGFINARIVKVDEKWEVDKEDEEKIGYITIHIFEGKRYFVGNISFKGNSLFSDKQLKKDMNLVEGKVFSERKFKKDLWSIQYKYYRQGYLSAFVNPIKDIDETNRVIDITYEITEGMRSHIEHIIVEGNVKTKEYVIKRELLVREGEVFNYQEVVRSQQKVFNLQFFKNVTFDVRPGSADGLMDLIFKVEEQSTGMVQFGLGYATESGVFGSARVSEINLFGTGRKVSFGGEVGSRKKSVSLSFEEPWLFGKPLDLSASVSYSLNTVDNVMVDDDRDGTADDYLKNPDGSYKLDENGDKIIPRYYRKEFSISIGITKRFRDLWSIGTGYSIYAYRNYDPNFTNPVVNTKDENGNFLTDENLLSSFSEGTKFKSTLRFNVRRDSRDNVLNPRSGSLGAVEVYYTGGIVGGNRQYIKINAYYSVFTKAFLGMVFGFNTMFGGLFKQLDGRFETETADRLWFDGIEQLRGWQNLSVYDNFKTYFSWELRYPIYQEMLWGTFFLDTGKLWPEFSKISFDPRRYWGSFGAGIRINIPMFPIRLYLARRFFYSDSLKRWTLYGSDRFFEHWEVVFSVAGLFQ